MKIPKVTSVQMKEVDKIAVKYQISLNQMLENGGRSLATLARSKFLNGSVLNKKLFVLVGSGGNGGGGLVAARFLFNWGAYVNVFMTRSIEELKGETKHQAMILENMGVPLHLAPSIAKISPEIDADLILDAVIGYSLEGEPRGDAAILIEFINKTQVPIISLDVPSGLNATTGDSYGPLTVKATATMTLGLPKTGLFLGNGRVYTGDLYLADIGIPLEVYKELDLHPENGIFHQASILKLKY